jgi:hypothetical protein
MEHLPPLGWGDVARKSDVLMLKEDNVRLENTMTTKADLQVLETRVDEMEKRFNIRFEALELRMTSVEKAIRDLDARLTSTTWKLVGMLFSGFGAVIFTVIKKG